MNIILRKECQWQEFWFSNLGLKICISISRCICKNSYSWIPSPKFSESNTQEVELNQPSLNSQGKLGRVGRSASRGSPWETYPSIPNSPVDSGIGEHDFPSTFSLLLYECSASSSLLRFQLCLKWAN